MYVLIGIGALLLIVAGWFLGKWLGRRLRGSQVGSESATQIGPDPNTHNIPPIQDLILSPDEVADKSMRTTRLLEMLAQTDTIFDPPALQDWVREFFLEVQECWQERDPDPVKDRMTPQALARFENLIAVMRRKHLVNRLDDLHVRRVEFVRVVCPADPEYHAFSTLITFEGKSRFIEEHSVANASSFGKNTWFQEFWTFQRHAEGWRLSEVTESWDDKQLREPNIIAGLSAAEMNNVERGVIML
jgi:predicted lipid-binding transport protein (Tim44 family)